MIGHPSWPAKTPKALANQRDTRRGVKNTPEHNAKISAAKIGHEVSTEQREKQRQKMLGRKHRPETIEKLRARKHTPEEIEKQKLAQTGRKLSSEHVENARIGLLKYYEKLRLAGVKKTASLETRLKMSSSQKLRHSKKKI